jgi:hypothetical protein
LERIFSPLLSANKDEPYTLSEVLRAVSRSTEKLHKFGKIEAETTALPHYRPKTSYTHALKFVHLPELNR